MPLPLQESVPDRDLPGLGPVIMSLCVHDRSDCLCGRPSADRIELAEMKLKLEAAEARVAELEREYASAASAQESLHDRIGQAVTLMREEVPNQICVMRDPKVGINQSVDCGQCWYCRVRAYVRDYDTQKIPDYAKDAGYVVDGAIHSWFELTYAQYLTIPRTALQSMPLEWQDRFVRCLEELDVTLDWRPEGGRYWVKLKDSKGWNMSDPLCDYERGRRRLPRNT